MKCPECFGDIAVRLTPIFGLKSAPGWTMVASKPVKKRKPTNKKEGK